MAAELNSGDVIYAFGKAPCLSCAGGIALRQRREEAMEKIRKLGALPAETKEFEGKDSVTLIKELSKVNVEIKKYSHVNKKAAEMFGSINESMANLKDTMGQRREERKKLEELIENLDEKKDEAVLRTFRQIKAHFHDMFRQLVGHSDATGELIMKKRSDLGYEVKQRKG
eukprot:gene4771-9665_t